MLMQFSAELYLLFMSTIVGLLSVVTQRPLFRLLAYFVLGFVLGLASFDAKMTDDVAHTCRILQEEVDYYY